MIKLMMLVAMLLPLTFGNPKKMEYAPTPATFSWAYQSYDAGKVLQNQPVSVQFTFHNTGKEPLVISQVKASCGCTVAEYPKEPVLPGTKGKVQVTYNAASLGVFHKTVTVYSNAKAETVLTLKGVTIATAP